MQHIYYQFNLVKFSKIATVCFVFPAFSKINYCGRKLDSENFRSNSFYEIYNETCFFKEKQEIYNDFNIITNSKEALNLNHLTKESLFIC